MKYIPQDHCDFYNQILSVATSQNKLSIGKVTKAKHPWLLVSKYTIINFKCFCKYLCNILVWSVCALLQ
jgi:hypothetical protein